MNTARTLFKNIATPSLREGLQEEVFQAITVASDAQRKRFLTMMYGGLVLSGVAMVYAGLTYGVMFFESEFWSVLSLLFSDVLVVANYWNDFLFLLLETVPVAPLLFVLVPTFMFLTFLSVCFKSIGVRRYSY